MTEDEWWEWMRRMVDTDWEVAKLRGDVVHIQPFRESLEVIDYCGKLYCSELGIKW